MAIAKEDDQSGTGTGSPINFTLTPAGTQRYASVLLTNRAGYVTGVTLGGVSMTLVPGSQVQNAAKPYIECYEMVDPPSGPQTVSISHALSAVHYRAFAFSGVDQTTPRRDVQTAVGTSNQTSVTVTTQSGDRCVQMSGADKNTFNAVGAGQLDPIFYPKTSNATGASSHEPVTGTSETLTATISASKTWAANAISLIEAGPASTLLVIADATHSHAADNAVLTQKHTLAIDAAAHGHTAEALTLTQKHTLAVQAATSGHVADNVTLAENPVLVVSDASHAHVADNLDLAVGFALTIQDATNAVTSDNIGLTQKHDLAVDDAQHAHAADNVVMTFSPFLRGLNRQFYEDDAGIDTATAIAAENASILRGVGTTQRYRLRQELEESNGGAETDSYAVFSNLNGGGFQKVTASSSNVRLTASSFVTDGAAITVQRLTGSGEPFISGEFDSNGTTASFQIGPNEHTELEFCMYSVEGDVGPGDFIDLELRHADGTQLDQFAPASIDVPASVALVVSDSTHGHTAENLTLSVSVTLAVADAAHGLASENLDLTQNQTLVTQDAAHGHLADNVVLAPSGTLDVNDGTHAHSAENVVLQAGEVVVQDSYQCYEDDAGLEAATPIAAVNVAIDRDVGPGHRVRVRVLLKETGGNPTTVVPTLRYSRELGAYQVVPVTPGGECYMIGSSFVANGAATAQLIGSGTFRAGEFSDDGQVGSITLQANEETEVEFCVALDVPGVNADRYDFRVYDGADPLSGYTNTARANTLFDHALVGLDAAHGHTAESPDLWETTTLVMADAAHAHAAENIDLDQKAVLGIADADHGHSSDQILLAQKHTVLIDEPIHAHIATQPNVFSGELPMPIGRVLNVAAENRSAGIAAENRFHKTDQP